MKSNNWSEAKNKWSRLSPNTRTGILIGVAFIVGWSFGGSNATDSQDVVYRDREVQVEKVVEKTPQVCIDALEMDNYIFQITGEGLSRYPAIGALDEATAYIEENTTKRNGLYMDCISRGQQ